VPGLLPGEVIQNIWLPQRNSFGLVLEKNTTLSQLARMLEQHPEPGVWLVVIASVDAVSNKFFR
jgi:hypothetical protein